MLPRLVHMGSILRVVTGTDGKRKIKPLGLGEKKVKANERQKEMQWMRKVRYREVGDSCVSSDGAENRKAGANGRVQDTGSDLHLSSVLRCSSQRQIIQHSFPTTPAQIPYPFTPTSHLIDWKRLFVMLGGPGEHKRGPKVRNGCGDQDFLHGEHRNACVQVEYISE